jgi:hypothetical protein
MDDIHLDRRDGAVQPRRGTYRWGGRTSKPCSTDDERADARLYRSDADRCQDFAAWLRTKTATAATPHSAASHPPAVYLTSQVSTPWRQSSFAWPGTPGVGSLAGSARG